MMRAAPGWLLRLYPLEWRARYGEEFAALLEDYQVSPLSLWDVLLGALDARLAPLDTNGRILRMLNQPRRSAITVFCAYIVFVLAGGSFNQMIEDDLKTLNGAHPQLAAAYYVVFYGAIVSLLAVLAGGLPIAYAILRRVLAEHRRDILLLFAVPPLALAVLLGWTWVGLNVIAPAHLGATAQSTSGHLLFVLWVALFGLAALASTAAVSIAVARCDVSPRLYRFALAPAVVTTVAMAVVLGGVVAWGLIANAELPEYLNGGTTPFRIDIGLSLIVHIAVMALVTFIAALAVIRAYRSPGRQAEAVGFTSAG
ncbi:MAG TPA: hypothetical protein VKT52_10010 [Ktedonobacterales bacterium]|nr:hypothetical protein [Ktedonobacterales bacterium]